MSDNTNNPAPEDARPVPPSPEGNNSPNGAIPQGQGDDPREALLRGLDKTPLDQEVKAHILAQLPSAEEQERMYRDLIENGGLTFEEMCESLGIESTCPFPSSFFPGAGCKD